MKQLIVLFDRSSGLNKYSVPTNVYRLSCALSGLSDRIIFYYSGNDTSDATLNLYPRKGFEEKLAEAYTDIMNNYRPGDKIYIFGFSSGAYIARVFANFIARVGVYKTPRYTEGLASALKAYKDGTLDRDINDHQYETIPERVSKVHMVEIEVVGCWDTVAGLGLPWKAGGISGRYEHFSPSLVKGIKHAFHALALDEYRRPFSPIMWFLPSDPVAAESIDLQQCWFTGAHSNVGGGYNDQALADLTLAWMVDLCRPFLDFDQEYINQVVVFHHQPSKLHSSRGRSTRLEHADGYDTEYQGWGRGRCYDSYRMGQTWTWKYRTPGGYYKETNETMHPSVRVRWQSSREENIELRDGPGIYAPTALSGFEPREGANGKWEWVKTRNGEEVLVIPETPFSGRDTLQTGKSFEALLRYAFVEPENHHKERFMANIY
ncbi:hypothetical protein GYMLUDRAFT_49007 [Collybiopsis luxurians FD-317 M1]|uniref:Unplaced genomic scaffold GYMLUscaffold_72, whole genome shotgun sequence n=1 Tax=Collybiopsis luxurians FD-317 M1 TaxID=944289 RepID=A0A0D0CGJ9_9AGAR|nr:hypothetical protein GYMLUDRAFT_49007 [Collybiopsis luxurians FD-317 M1]